MYIGRVNPIFNLDVSTFKIKTMKDLDYFHSVPEAEPIGLCLLALSKSCITIS